MKTFKQYLNEKSLDVRTLSPEGIAKKHGVSVDNVMAQIERGAKIEAEHTKSKKKAREIARDHLGEFIDYYKELDKMETKMKKVNEMEMKLKLQQIQEPTKPKKRKLPEKDEFNPDDYWAKVERPKKK